MPRCPATITQADVARTNLADDPLRFALSSALAYPNGPLCWDIVVQPRVSSLQPSWIDLLTPVNPARLAATMAAVLRDVGAGPINPPKARLVARVPAERVTKYEADLSSIRYRVDPRDIPASKAGRRLHLTLAEFEEKLPALLKRGFPKPDPDTGNFDLHAIDRWCDQRHGGSSTPQARDARDVVQDRIAKLREGARVG